MYYIYLYTYVFTLMHVYIYTDIGIQIYASMHVYISGRDLWGPFRSLSHTYAAFILREVARADVCRRLDGMTWRGCCHYFLKNSALSCELPFLWPFHCSGSMRLWVGLWLGKRNCFAYFLPQHIGYACTFPTYIAYKLRQVFSLHAETHRSNWAGWLGGAVDHTSEKLRRHSLAELSRLRIIAATKDGKMARK